MTGKNKYLVIRKNLLTKRGGRDIIIKLSRRAEWLQGIRKENIEKVLTNGKECDIIDKLFRTADKRKRVHRSLKIKQYCKERTDPEDYRRGVEGNGYEPEGVSSVRKYEPRNRRKGNSKEANEERVKSLEFGLRKSLHARRRACIKDLTKSLILAQDERWRRA